MHCIWLKIIIIRSKCTIATIYSQRRKNRAKCDKNTRYCAFFTRKMSDELGPGNSDVHEDTSFTTTTGGRPPGKSKGKKKWPSITPHTMKINYKWEQKKRRDLKRKRKCHDEKQQL